ncbi:MAG: phosphatase PAP2 family protein, partial [Candidatus Omnitrophota bacterium]
AVFLAALNAVITGYIIFSRRFSLHIEDQIILVAHSAWHLTFIALILVIALVITGKVLFHKGTPFKGGMPSGHAAVAFSIWTIIIFSTGNALITVLTFVMAFLIARHRLKDGIHTLWEVIAGAILGVLTTTVVFQLLL